jgi:hypothetical protein
MYPDKSRSDTNLASHLNVSALGAFTFIRAARTETFVFLKYGI